MKLLTKVALVSAMAISANAMALQSMDDEALSAATGQDGITITVSTTGISIDKLLIHDNDGLSAAATTNGGLGLGGTGTAGAIVLNGVTVGVSATQANAAFGGALARVTIDTDAGATGDDPFLNVNLKTNGIDVGVDDISIGKSNTVASMTGARRGATDETVIIDGLSLTIGASEMNIQLGDQPQGAMIVANGTIMGGITINSLNLNDNSTGGQIHVGGLKITSANSANLNVNTAISVLPTAVAGGGLSITSSGAQDLYISSLALGNNNSIGSIELQGLDMGNSRVIISGH